MKSSQLIDSAGALDAFVASLSESPDAYTSFHKQYMDATEEERASLLLQFATTEQELARMTTSEQSIVWTTTVTTTTVTTHSAD